MLDVCTCLRHQSPGPCQVFEQIQLRAGEDSTPFLPRRTRLFPFGRLAPQCTNLGDFEIDHTWFGALRIVSCIL